MGTENPSASASASVLLPPSFACLMRSKGSEAEAKGRVSALTYELGGEVGRQHFFSLVEGGSFQGEKAVATAKPKAAAKPKVMVGVKGKAAKKLKLKTATKAVKTSAKATLGKKAVEKVATANLKKTSMKKLKSMKTRMKKAKK